MATYAVEAVEIFGQGVLQAEGVVIDKAGSVYGGGRNGILYKVSPDGQVSELVTLPSGVGQFPTALPWIVTAIWSTAIWESKPWYV